MKRYAITLAALLLSASAVMADPVFTSGDLFGAYTVAVHGQNSNGPFDYSGVIRFDGVGHIVNTNAKPSYIINTVFNTATGVASQCRYNVMNQPGILTTVSALDSSLRLPLMQVPFKSQNPACAGPNTWAGVMNSPGLVNVTVTGGATGSGTLVKQSQQ